jgi:uncharacterized PurR-regulated membrane protein YhhQ (DUF165 family)
MGGEGIRQVEGDALAQARFRYFDFVMAAFVAILLLSNVIGAGKRAEIELPLIGLWPFGAGILFFPLSYVIGDILTEVYGYARARRCIWAGFVADPVHGSDELGGGGAAAGGRLARPGRL